MHRFKEICKGMGEGNKKPEFMWKNFPNILQLIPKQRYDDVLEASKNEMNKTTGKVYGAFATDGSKWEAFKERFIRKYIPDRMALEAIASAFRNVYKKPDHVSLEDHNSRSLVIEARTL